MHSRLSTDPVAWDAFVEAGEGHLLQTSRWGMLKSAFGWEYQIVSAGGGQDINGGALMLFRQLPLRLGTIAYVPRGPVVDWQDEPTVQRLVEALDSAARARRAALLKIEPDLQDTSQTRSQLSALGFRPSPQTVQPPRTLIIDIGGSEDDILARMNQGTRHNIRTAQKREVAVRRGGERDLNSFCALTAITGERDGFGVHSPQYFKQLYELFAPEHAAILMASYAGRDLGGLMAFALGRRAWYLYGASSSDERERMPNYALQWEAIRWARERGCTEYDLWGIPDEEKAVLEAQFQARHDGLWGVYGFKRGFGGRMRRAVGAWDRVYNSAIYVAYRLAVRQRD